jgi:FAD synthase|tara:strand:- start:364 stop:669 length:306 start_codon:yes stop_codon:yes gene_type:complete
MAHAVTIHDFVNDVVITKDGFTTITEAKIEAERYIHKSKVDRLHCQNLSVVSEFVQGKMLMIDISKEDKKYASYYWVPMHPRYEPHLVMRGGYFRKVKETK